MFFRKKDKTKNVAKLSKSERESLARELLQEGNQALEKGKVEAALESFRQLIRVEPEDPDHRRRLADCQGRLGDKKAELEARCKAATLYAEAGFLLKGIAMCKLALAIDPTHRETLKQLAELNELTGKGAPAPQRPSPEEEEARKDRALVEARARVEQVRAERAKRAAARKAAKGKTAALETTEVAAKTRANESESPLEEAPPRSLSFSDGAPLDQLPLQSALPNLSKKGSAPAIEVSLSENEDDIFIAPLDEEDADPESAATNVPRLPELDSTLRRVPLLSDLKPETFVALVDQVGFVELEAGQVLFEAGDVAEAMYCIIEGQVTATLPGPAAHEIELARLGEGEFFGEIGLIAEQPRGATITATEPTMLLVFERQIVGELTRTEPDFVKILLRFVRERLVASLIASSPLFAPFVGPEAEDLTRRFRFLDVKARKPLVRQGTPSGGVFILLSGGARVVLSSDGTTHELSRLGPGDIFGEMSLINGQDAVASVITDRKSFVLELPAKDFTQLVMMHPALLAYVSAVASKREARNATLLSGGGDYIEDRLSLV